MSLAVLILVYGRSSLTNEKDHHYFLNRFVCVHLVISYGLLGQF